MQHGHIYRHRNCWYLRYYDSVRENGQVVRKQRCKKLAPFNKNFQTKSSVASLAEKILSPINSGILQPESTETVLNFIELNYLPHADKALRPSTVKGYRDILRHHLKHRLGDVTLRDFRTVHGQRLLRQIHFEDKIGHTSLSRVKSFLSSVFTYALREGVLDGVNPIRAVQIPGRPERKKLPVYTLTEIVEMLGVLPAPARMIVAVAGFTGLRLSEIRGLQWKDYDVDSENSLLHVRRSVWRRHVGPTKTLESESPVPVLRIVKTALNAHRRNHKEPPKPDDYIFAGERGFALNLANLARRVIKPKIEASRDDGGAGIKWKGWHALRRAVASNLYALDVQPKIIQAILRHSNLATTMQSYVHTDDAAAREALKKLDAAANLFGESTGS